MHVRRNQLALLAGLWVTALLLSGTSAHGEYFIGKLAKKGQGVYAGKPHAIIAVTNPALLKAAVFGIPNKDEAAAKLDPLPDLLTAVQGFKANDMVQVTFTGTYTGATPNAMITAIVPYELKPGEGEPNAFIFTQTYDKKDGKLSYTMVDLKKFNEPLTLTVPSHKDKGGDLEPDPEILAAVNALKEGDVVLVNFSGGAKKTRMITHIERYTAPENGKLVKVDDAADLDGAKATSVDIDEDGKTITAFVPGKADGKRFTMDPKILAEVKHLHKDADITFRTSEEGGHVFLRAISAAKPTDMHAPAAATKPSEK